MARVRRRSGSVLAKTGLQIDWDDKDLVRKIDIEINKIVSIGAKSVEALSKSMVPVESGNLRKTIKARKARYKDRDKIGWTISAGEDKGFGNVGAVDYAAHVELGRYFKATGTRIAPVPFIRRPIEIMRKKIRRLFVNRLRRILS